MRAQAQLSNNPNTGKVVLSLLNHTGDWSRPDRKPAVPEGFAYGFFLANNTIDHPVPAQCWKYDRLDARLLRTTLDAGVRARDLADAISDDYHNQADYATEQSVRELTSSHTRQGPARSLAVDC